MVTIVDKAVDSIDVATTPGLWLVDSLPFLRYLPTWFPGTGFKMVAAELRKLLLDMVDVPYAFTKQKLVTFLILIHQPKLNLVISHLYNRLKMLNSHPISWQIISGREKSAPK